MGGPVPRHPRRTAFGPVFAARAGRRPGGCRGASSRGWARGVPRGAGFTRLVGLPALPGEPFFVAVNAAVVCSLVALGHYLVAQHGERFTGLCFSAAAGGWVLLNLDVHGGWGPLPAWLLGSGVVFIAIGCAV